jgi:hypothetical protein
MTPKEFNEALTAGKCPFCGLKFTYYDGALGYEALKCEPCRVTYDDYGLNVDDAPANLTGG